MNDHFCNKPKFPEININDLCEKIGKKNMLWALGEMVKIRHFERRGEYGYQNGKVWGFYHTYSGQEAIQVGAVLALGKGHLWVTSYRCHALSLLLGMSLREGMCELHGKSNGNAKGRGGSMHLYCDNMFGGHGIVGGQWPIGAGLAFGIKYMKKKGSLAICFGGDGAVAQGTFHESLNLSKLWDLPVIFVIENNHWGMGTSVDRALAKLPIGENCSKAYGMKAYSVDGMSFPSCYHTFSEAKEYSLKHQTPVLVEAITHRLRGHSISDPAKYRSKEEIKSAMAQDPLENMKDLLMKKSWIDEAGLQKINDEILSLVKESVDFADKSPFPDPKYLAEDVII